MAAARRFAPWVVCAWLVVGAGCRTSMSPDSGVELLAGWYLDAYWCMHPSRAAAAGLRQFEAVAPDRSDRTIREWIRFNRQTRDRLRNIDPGPLSESSRVDVALLQCTIGSELITFDDLQAHRRNPMVYDIGWGLLELVRPGGQRIAERREAAIRLLDGCPAMFTQARRNLDTVLPRIYGEVTIANLEGLSEYLRHGIMRDLFAGDAGDESLRLAEAAIQAADATDEFVTFLRQDRLPYADEAFAVGEAMLRKILRETEGIDLSADELLALGEADLQRNRERAERLVRAHWPGKSPASVVGMMKAGTYPPASMLSAVASDVEALRRFCAAHEIIHLAPSVQTVVAETPAFARWTAAMMDAPGPYESAGAEAFYYVATDEPGWSAEERRQWWADFNRYTALNISIHEVYPGHLAQTLRTNQAGSAAQKAFFSYAAVEGWAHYVEEMMFEAGFMADEPLYELAQILDALLRDCRLICAVRLHARGMSIDEAARFFQEFAYVEPLTARHEAQRGTFDPTYLMYTLGKLQILKLREDYRARQGAAFSLKRFHDEFLSHGMPPVAVTRARLLGPDAGPSL